MDSPFKMLKIIEHSHLTIHRKPFAKILLLKFEISKAREGLRNFRGAVILAVEEASFMFVGICFLNVDAPRDRHYTVKVVNIEHLTYPWVHFGSTTKSI